jgi:hypothetical protein
VQIIVFAMAEDDVRTVMAHPRAVASDGWTLSPDEGGKPHPRSYGSCARILETYVREDRVLTLEDAIRKMTSLPAQRLRCADRGIAKERFHAPQRGSDATTPAATRRPKDVAGLNVTADPLGYFRRLRGPACDLLLARLPVPRLLSNSS